MTDAKLREMLRAQLAADYNCFAEDFDNNNTLITTRAADPRRRMYEEDDGIASFLIYEDKLVITAEEEFLDAAAEFFEHAESEWAFEVSELSALDRLLAGFGFELGAARVGYIPRSRRLDIDKIEGVELLEGESLDFFRGDKRFSEALLFSRVAPDMLAAAYKNDRGEILGMAGASRNSASMWEMGVNVVPEARREGIGSMLVAALADEVLKRGRLPYFNCCMSHIAAQRTALAAGLVPAFCEVRSFPARGESPFED